MQFLANITGAPVDRSAVAEITALGAAYLAGLQMGIYPEPTILRRSGPCSGGLTRRWPGQNNSSDDACLTPLDQIPSLGPMLRHG